MTYNEAKSEYRLFFDGDHWGHVMHWWFTVADEIYHCRDFPVPAEWEFKPSPLGPINDPEDYATNVVTEMSDSDLLRFGQLLHRYASVLKQAGVDY